MPTDYLVFIVLAPLAAVVSIWLTVYCLGRRTAPGALALAWHMIAISAWLLTYVFELLGQTETGALLWDKLCYLPISVAPVTLFIFGLHYTGRQRWATTAHLLPMFAIPLTTFGLALTNEYHHLIWQSYVFIRIGPLITQHPTAYGAWFWVYVAYAYGLTAANAIMVFTSFYRSARIYRQQTTWVLIGAFVPILANAVYISRLFPNLRADYSPVAFALGGIFFALGIFRYQLFDLRPIARNALVDSMSDAVLVLDSLKRIVDVNPAALGIAGLPADSLIGQPVGSALPAWSFLDGELGDRAGKQNEISLAQDGSQHDYDLHISLLEGERGRVVGYLVTLHDVTEHQRLIHELDAYAHTVAHDLVSPLSVIIGYADLFQGAPDDQISQEVRVGLGHVNQIAQTMVSIVKNLLLMANVRQQADIPYEPLDMATIVKDVQDRLAPVAENAGAEIAAPDRWPAAIGFAPWVAEIWANYLTNALKYGGRPPHITLGCDPQAGDMLRFWVRDDGPGLTPEQAARLFTPYTRLDRGRAAGHGLGLSIVQRIAERLGGTVGVESRPGQGSLFFFTLPAATAGGD